MALPFYCPPQKENNWYLATIGPYRWDGKYASYSLNIKPLVSPKNLAKIFIHLFISQKKRGRLKGQPL